MRKMVFVFSLDGKEISIPVEEWGMNIPKVGDFIYLYDFLEDGIKDEKISKFIESNKFRIDELMWRKDGDNRRVQYSVTPVAL